MFNGGATAKEVRLSWGLNIPERYSAPWRDSRSILPFGSGRIHKTMRMYDIGGPISFRSSGRAQCSVDVHYRRDEHYHRLPYFLPCKIAWKEIMNKIPLPDKTDARWKLSRTPTGRVTMSADITTTHWTDKAMSSSAARGRLCSTTLR
jgi:hypothetical protein